MAAYGLIGQDMAVSIAIGDVANGQPPTFGGTSVITGRVQQIRTRASKKKVDVSGLGYTTESNRYGTMSGEMTLDTFVHADGRLFEDAVNGAYLGRYIMVQELPVSSLNNPSVWVGVITEWETTAKNDDAQAENITIDLTPDYTT